MHQKEFIAIYEQLKNGLYRYALRMTGNETDAADIVQEVSLKLWDKRNQLPSIKNVEAWSIQLCKNRFIDFCRQKGRKMTYELKPENDNAVMTVISNQIEAKDELTMIHQFVQRLPDAQKEVFQLREIEGMSHKEISKATGLSESQVKVYSHRARKAIKLFLEQQHAYKGAL